MKDHVEIRNLSEYDAFRVDRDQVLDLKLWFKILTNAFNFGTASPEKKTYIVLIFFNQVCDNCKVPSCTYHLKEAEMKIAMFAQFKEYDGNR